MEGRQRHGNVKSAIRAVIEEQQRQRIMDPNERRSDPRRRSASTGDVSLDDTKVRMVYLQHTHWARALARAAGQSDADAVRTVFEESRRKPREYYLKLFLSTDTSSLSSGTSDGQPADLPCFMKTVLKINASRLDENTASQLQFQRKKARGAIPEKCSNKISAGTALGLPKNPMNSPNEPTMRCPSDLPEKKICEAEDEIIVIAHTEPTSPTSLAKKAAGWGIEDSEAKDLSAVLAGMGTVS
jgi:hypothetical protein